MIIRQKVLSPGMASVRTATAGYLHIGSRQPTRSNVTHLVPILQFRQYASKSPRWSEGEKASPPVWRSIRNASSGSAPISNTKSGAIPKPASTEDDQPKPYSYETVPRPKVTMEAGKKKIEISQLSRPIGQYEPPKPKEKHHSISSLKYMKNGFKSREHIEKQKQQLSKEWRTSYFQDWADMRHQKGKIFISPTRTFKADRALYFPNLGGRTLLGPDEVHTTSLFSGRLSLVSLSATAWGLAQIKTFTKDIDDGTFANSALLKDTYMAQPDDYIKRLMDEPQPPLDGVWQKVHINIQESSLKAWMVILSMRSIRKQLGEEDHAKYLLVRDGLAPEVKQAMGMLNERLGYIYLVDAECRIRWVGCAEASDEEREALKSNMERLVLEEQSRREALKNTLVRRQ